MRSRPTSSEHVLAYVHSERDHFVKGVLKETDSFPQDTIIRGFARFESRNVLLIDDFARVETTSVVIASGLASIIPDDFKVFEDHIMTSDDVFDLKTLPRRCAVFGASPIALELAQAFAQLWVDIFSCSARRTTLARCRTPLWGDALIEVLQQEFYLDPNATILEKSMQDGEPTIRFKSLDGTERTERFDRVLIAAGRKPALASLQLEKTRIELNDKGVPVFDESSMQCGDSSIFIAGDCDGTRPFLSDAADEGKLAGDNAARFPEVQSVKRYRFPSAQGCGPALEHLGHLIAWALQLNLSVEDMLKLPFYHPVMALKEANKKCFQARAQTAPELPNAAVLAAPGTTIEKARSGKSAGTNFLLLRENRI